MQKLLARSKYASQYSSRRLTKRQALEEWQKVKRDVINYKTIRDEIRQQNKANKQARWNSIYRGQLAPRQDAGADAERYGAVHGQRTQPMRVHKKHRQPCPFVPGDRVVLVGAQYRDRGKIGKVERIDEKGQCLYIEKVELASVFQQKFMRKMIKSDSPVQTASLPVAFKDCRLVYPLENPSTGALRDVIINEIELRDPTIQERKAGVDKPIRLIAGVEPPVELPYPDTPEQEFEDTNSDTLRIEVEERTWVPTLGIPPMPPNVIDELRHKYSKYRTRFDDEFIAKKEAAHQRVMDKKLALKQAAITPIDELNRLKREEQRRLNEAAAVYGAWVPLSSEIIQGMARLGLEHEAKTGRALPKRTKEQFERIEAGFANDVVEEEAKQEVIESDNEEMELMDEEELEELEASGVHEADPSQLEDEAQDRHKPN